MKFSIDNKTIYVWLPNKLFKELENRITIRKQSGTLPVLQLAQAAYLLNLVIYIPFSKKGKYEDGWVPICATANSSISHFSAYMQFLVEEKLLNKSGDNYSSVSHSCCKFRLAKPYYDHKVKLIEVKGNLGFIKKREEYRSKRMAKAENSTGHLTKWLKTELFQVEYDEAKSLISDKYFKKKDLIKANRRMMVIESLKHSGWAYSREGKDDRLHSILTSLPKDLRKFVKYENKFLCSIDIKNSQPYIFTSILNNLRHNDEYGIRPILNTNKLIPNMLDVLDDPNVDGDLERFVDLVQKGTIYESYGKVLYDCGLIYKDCCGGHLHISQSKSGKEISTYDSLRKASKDIMMKTLFSSYNNRQDIIDIFKEEYPSVYGIMQKIKGTKGNEKNYFPILLQNIEANCILDYCTKKISADYPSIPLFTIHDSIVTTVDNMPIVEQKFKESLVTYFGSIPQLKLEPWYNTLELAA